MEPSELEAGDRLVRLAFGTFLGLPEPTETFGDAQVVATRFRQSPADTLVAAEGGEVVGLVQLARWGSAAVLGPLATSPARWDRGVGRALLGAALEHIDAWGVSLTALFTFSASPKHVSLYHRVGFAPQTLTAVMARELEPRATSEPATLARGDALGVAGLRPVTDALYPGLDLGLEIATVLDQGVGEVVVLEDARGFAVCHLGAGEAAPGTCYVKCAAVAPGPRAGDDFAALLARVEALAAGRGLGRVEAGVDTARRAAFAALLDAGYRTAMLGVRMTRPDRVGWSGAGDYALDDLR